MTARQSGSTSHETKEDTLAGSPDHLMKKYEKSTPSDSTGSINPVLVRFAWWCFFFFSIFSASSASRKTQLTWAPSFMWLSYSFCHKSGCKSSLALSRGLVFVRSCTNHGVKHNSGVVVKLFTFPLIHFCDLWRDLRQNRKTMRCLSCSPHRWSRCRSDDEGQSPVKLYNLMSF